MAPRLTLRASVIAARFKSDFDDVDPLAKEIAARLVQLTMLYEQHNKPMFDLHHINRGMFSALVCLRLSGQPYELRHRDLLDQMLLTSGGITNLCSRLKSLDLIDSHPDPEDGRGVVFRLTESGLRLADELLPQQHRLERELTADFTDSDKQQFRDLLEKATARYDP